MHSISRLRLALAMVGTVMIVGTIGFVLLGLSFVDALYMTVTTVTTVGFREVIPDPNTKVKLFTLVVILTGVSTVLYTFTLGVQVVVEGQLREFVGRRRMDRKIAKLSGHVVVCGWGRVGRAATHDLLRAGREVVIVDFDESRLAEVNLPVVLGDATSDEVLQAAGIERASALIAALTGDADNLFVTLSGRSMKPDLFIVSRARQDQSIEKLTRAGADRVVNPQELGAARMASFIVSPNVAEFVDVVMHERSFEFRMEEVEVAETSSIANQTLRDADLRNQAGVLVLALRDRDGTFIANPDPNTVIQPHQVVIAVGMEGDFERLRQISQ